MSQLRTFCALAAAPAACRLLRRTLRAAGGGVAPVKNGIVAVLSACAVVAVVAVQSIAFTPDARAQTSNPCSAGQGVFPNGQCHTCPPAYENSATLTADGFCTCPEGEDFIAVLGDVGSNVCASQNIADAFKQCEASGYSPSYVGEEQPNRNFCRVRTRNVGQSQTADLCYLDDSSDTVSPHCTAVFGPDLVIPQKPTDGSRPRYVFNCNPDGDNEMIPATINTIGATECACSAGKGIQNGVCVAASAEACGGLTPAQFYDAAAGACVPYVTCVSPEVLHADVNDCHAHAPSAQPLHRAVLAGDLDLVNHFITVHMADVDESWYSNTPLILAARYGHASIAAALIAAGADVEADSVGVTPLIFAIGNRHVTVVALLLAAGADVNAKNKDDETPLHFAVEGGDVSIVAALLAAGAEVNATSSDNRTPLARAALYTMTVVYPALIAAGGHWGTDCASIGELVNPASNTPPCLDLHQAAAGGHVSAVATLLATGATLDARDGDDNTPLHLSADGGHVAVVSLLIQATASLNVKNNDDDTPLHLAAGGGHTAVVSLLIQATASLNVKNDDEKAPLHLAAEAGHAAIVALQAGAYDDDTPLHLAAGGGHTAVVSLLIQATASLNVKNDDEKAPLHLAAEAGHAAIVALLVEAGAYWGDAACESGEVTNPAGATPPCVCEPPTVGTAGNCAAPSKDNCRGLNPVQFYDAAADACVLFVECGPGEVVYPDANDCHASGGYPLHDAVEAGDLELVNHFITVHMQSPR